MIIFDTVMGSRDLVSRLVSRPIFASLGLKGFGSRLGLGKDNQNIRLVSASPSRSKTSGRRPWTADQGLIDRRGLSACSHRIRFYALVNYKRKM